MENTALLLCIKGVMIGSIYALISLGFNVIFRTTGVLNFAQGEFVMIGGILASWLHSKGGIPMFGCVVLGVLGAGLVGVLVDLLAIRPVRAAKPVLHVIITVGVSIVLRSLAALFWGTEPYHMPPLQAGGFKFCSVAVDYQSLWMAFSAVVIMAVLSLFFRYSETGRAMRACAEDPVAARLCGVNPGNMSSMAFGLSAMMAGLAGILLTPMISMSFDRGAMLGLKGFAAAIMGGLGSPIGGVVSGLLLGVLEQLGAWYSSAYKETFALGMVLVVLLFRPKGLWGGK
jgi:branched-chain amino acid transport system permease protein